MAVPDLEAAVGHADIVSCATLAMTPLIHGRRLRSGSHLDLIGSFTPSMREAADDCFVDAALYVDTEEALRKSGDLLEPIKRDPADVRCTLTTLARGEASGSGALRTSEPSSSPLGTALEDLAVAIEVFERPHVAV